MGIDVGNVWQIDARQSIQSLKVGYQVHEGFLRT
jgi:hypothetical protein